MQIDPGAKADTILLGNVLTFDDAKPKAEAVAIAGSRILAVGDKADVLALKGARTRVVDHGRSTVIPGFNDTHAHLDMVGLQTIRPRLDTASSIKDVLAIISSLAKDTPKGEWIVTMPVGKPPSFFGGPATLDEKRLPNRAELDAAAPDHPVCISAPSGYWSCPPCYTALNSRALALNGIDRHRKPVAKGVEIEHDEAGEPTGIIVDRNFPEAALLDVLAAVPRFTRDCRVEAIKRGCKIFHSKGVTSIYEGHGSAPLVIGMYRALHEAGDLTMRTALTVNPLLDDVANADVAFRDWLAYAQGFGVGDEILRISGVHIAFGGDPAIGQLAKRDSTDINYSGYVKQAHDPETFEALCFAAAKNDLRVHVIVADWLEKVLPVLHRVNAKYPLRGKRWVIEHLAGSTPEMLLEVQSLGLGVTIIPSFHLWKVGARYLERSQAEQDMTVPAKQLLQLGVPVAAGTDAIPCEPLLNVWSMVRRTERVSGRAVGAEGCVSAAQAMHLMTRAGAWFTFEENSKGRLKPGYLADVAVLSDDPTAVEPDAIPQIKCLATMVGGNLVFEAT